MVLSDAAKRRSGYGLVFGLAGGLSLLHLHHAIQDEEGEWAFLFGILLPMALCLAVVLGGVWLRRNGVGPEYVFRVGGGCVVGAAILTAGSVLTILYQRAHGVVMDDQLYVAADLASFGVLIGFVLGVYDGRQQRARNHASSARERAERLTRRLSVVNRVLRHDLRNRANVVLGRAEMLAEERPDEHATAIRAEATDLVAVSRQARDVERLLRAEDVDREVVDIVTVVEDHLERIAEDYPAVEVRRPETETGRVYAHPHVGSAIGNVVDNAVVHNDKATPRVESDVRRDGDAIEVRIADNGPGIPDHEVTVLDRGYETPLEHTSGLGLWLVNWVVDESGGDVRFEDDGSEGSVVCLRFQCVRSAAETRGRD